MGDRLETPRCRRLFHHFIFYFEHLFIFLQPLPAPFSITEHETIAQRLLTNGPKRSKPIATAETVNRVYDHYHDEHTRSRLITEVKHRRAWIVLGWGTAWELPVP